MEATAAHAMLVSLERDLCSGDVIAPERIALLVAIAPAWLDAAEEGAEMTEQRDDYYYQAERDALAAHVAEEAATAARTMLVRALDRLVKLEPEGKLAAELVAFLCDCGAR